MEASSDSRAFFVARAGSGQIPLLTQNVADVLQAYADLALQACRTWIGLGEILYDAQAFFVACAGAGEVSLIDQNVADLVKARADVTLQARGTRVGLSLVFSVQCSVFRQKSMCRHCD